MVAHHTVFTVRHNQHSADMPDGYNGVDNGCVRSYRAWWVAVASGLQFSIVRRSCIHPDTQTLVVVQQTFVVVFSKYRSGTGRNMNWKQQSFSASH